MRRAAFPLRPSAPDCLLPAIISCLPVPSWGCPACLPGKTVPRGSSGPRDSWTQHASAPPLFKASLPTLTHIISFHLRSNVGLSNPTSTASGRVLGIHLTDEGRRLISRALDYLLFLPEKSPAQSTTNTGQGRQCVNRERKDEQEYELFVSLSTHTPPPLPRGLCSRLIITFAKRSGHPT